MLGHWTPLVMYIIVSYQGTYFCCKTVSQASSRLVWNEVSRRYVDDDPEFYFPETWRGKPTDKKQGSSEEEIVWLDREHRVGCC